MPSRERCERKRRELEGLREIGWAFDRSHAQAPAGRLSQEEIERSNAELASGAGRYCIRGVKIGSDGQFIPQRNWGKNTTWRLNQLAAEKWALALRRVAGPDWGNPKKIRQIIFRAEKAGIPVPSSRTVRRYFARYP